MSTYITSFNQTLLDICLVLYGSLDYLVQLMSDNDLQLNDYIPPGTSILYNSSFTPAPTTYTTGELIGNYIPIVTGLQVSNLTSTTATVSWNAIPNNLSYQFYLTTIGVPLFLGTSFVFTNSKNLTSLIPNTHYYFFIKNLQSVGNLSNYQLVEFITSSL